MGNRSEILVKPYVIKAKDTKKDKKLLILLDFGLKNSSTKPIYRDKKQGLLSESFNNRSKPNANIEINTNNK